MPLSVSFAMTELTVRTGWMADRERDFSLCEVGEDIDHPNHCRIAVLDEQNTLLSNRNRGMYFMAGRNVVVPNYFLLRCNLRHAVLMREEYVAVRKHHRVADFTFTGRVVITPYDRSLLNDEDLTIV